jgi:hypothetical protein
MSWLDFIMVHKKVLNFGWIAEQLADYVLFGQQGHQQPQLSYTSKQMIRRNT